MSKKHLIFLHGFLENANMWNPILNRISKSNYELHFPEIPGHGKNLTRVEPSMESYVQNIIEQVNLPAGDSYFFVGHSMGGYIGAHFCTTLKEKCLGLCLFHSKAGADDAEKIAARDRAIEAAKENKALYIRTMINGLFPDTTRENFREKIEEQIIYAQSLETEAITDSLGVMRDRSSTLEAMVNRNFPLYYFLGSEDKSIPLDVAMKEVEMLPGSAPQIVQGIGHMGHIEHPVSAGDFIQRILRASE